MFHASLKLIDVKAKLEMNDHFIPNDYWVSGKLNDQLKSINVYVNQIIPGIKMTNKFGGNKTLHIGTNEEVILYYGKNLFVISFNVLFELNNLKMHDFYVNHKNQQCISLSLLNLKISANDYQREEMNEIFKKVTLLGGKFVPFGKNHSNIDILVTDNPILPFSVLNMIDSINVLNKKWIEDCFNNCSKQKFNDYLLPHFYSLKLSSSDINPNQISLIKDIIVKGGGSYNDSLDNSVTILIASRFSMTSKIKLAISSYIPIVKPEWIFEQRNKFCDINQYILNFWCVKDFKSYLFENITFTIHDGCNEKKLLIEAIEANSGKINNYSNIFIVPNFYKIKNNKLNYVTPAWIWNCISEQRLIQESESIIYKPFPFLSPSDTFKGYVVVLYNLKDQIKYELSEGLRLLGFCVHFKISKNSNIIVSEFIDDYLKKQQASSNIPIVSLNWVYDVFNSNVIPDYEAYLLIKKQELNNNIKDISEKLINIRENGNILTKEKNNNVLSDFLSIDDLTNFSQDDKEEHVSSPLNITYELNKNVNNIELTEKFDHDPLLEVLSHL